MGSDWLRRKTRRTRRKSIAIPGFAIGTGTVIDLKRFLIDEVRRTRRSRCRRVWRWDEPSTLQRIESPTELGEPRRSAGGGLGTATMLPFRLRGLSPDDSGRSIWNQVPPKQLSSKQPTRNR